MKPGRKPKPTALKIISGNAGKRKLPNDEPVFKHAKPKPPPFLNAEALQEWHEKIDILFAAGVLTEIDGTLFAAYCDSYATWAQAKYELEKLREEENINGLLHETRDGNFIQQPLLGIANKAKADMVRYATEFGMGASARARISINPSGKKENPFAQFDD